MRCSVQTANATLTMLYWRIGLRIGVELLQKERAPYGQEIVSAVETKPLWALMQLRPLCLAL